VQIISGDSSEFMYLYLDQSTKYVLQLTQTILDTEFNLTAQELNCTSKMMSQLHIKFNPFIKPY
jgi:hypothetical protein